MNCNLRSVIIFIFQMKLNKIRLPKMTELVSSQTQAVWFQSPNHGGSGRRTKRDWELPHVRSQGQRPRVPGCEGTGTAGRSHPASKVTGGRERTPLVRGQGVGWEELPSIRGQWWPGGDTPRLRSGVAGRSHLAPGRWPWGAPRARGQGQWLGGATWGAVAEQAQEGLEELSHIEGQEQRL